MLSENLKKLNALLLIGGKSRRMGRDKSVLEYYEQPQYQHVINLVEPLVNRVYLSVHKNQQMDYPYTMTDNYDDLGPFGGILTALETFPDCSFLVLAVDLPFLTVENLKYLITQRDVTAKATAFYIPEKNFPEPLACIWEHSILPDLQESFNQKIYKPIRVLEQVQAKKVALDPFYLQNINTPEEYLNCKKQIKNLNPLT